MRTLRIPRKQYATLKKVIELNDTQFSEFLNGLEQVSPSVSPGTLAKRLAALVKSVPEEDIEAYILLLCGLYPAKESRDKTSKEIASDIKKALLAEMPPGFDAEGISVVEGRVQALLSIDKGIAVTAKALDVVTEHNHLFCAAKIYSDIRPVFSSDADSISGAVVQHSLNITYHQGEDHKEFYVTLDTGELAELKEAIERAEKKAKHLNSMLRNAGVISLEEDL